MSIFNDLLAETNNEYAAIADEGVEAGDVSGYIGTGSYAMNALLSGSIYGGLPQNKVTAFAGEPSVGKTFYALNVVKQFLIDNPNGFVFYFESESAISKEMMTSRGIDTKRIAVMPVATIQEFRTQAVKILDKYIEQKSNKDRPPMLFVLDSLGNLSTTKEMEDTAEGKDTRDMTKAQVIKAAFRVLTLKLAKVKVPMLVTNHVYDLVGSYVPTKEMGGGTGLKYAASTIAYLSKKKERDGDEIVGNIVKIKMHKSRLSRENQEASVLLTYTQGLNRYYGLLDLAEKYGIFKKVSTRYEMPDGKKVFGKEINENPEKYYTEEILAKLDECARQEYSYGVVGSPQENLDD